MVHVLWVNARSLVDDAAKGLLFCNIFVSFWRMSNLFVSVWWLRNIFVHADACLGIFPRCDLVNNSSLNRSRSSKSGMNLRNLVNQEWNVWTFNYKSPSLNLFALWIDAMWRCKLWIYIQCRGVKFERFLRNVFLEILI